MNILIILLKILIQSLGKIWKNRNLPQKGTVLYIIDGDSLVMKDDQGKEHEVRVRGMDAPEMGQPHGKNAKKALEEMTKGKSILLKGPEMDQYGRIAAQVIIEEGDCVALEMIQSGNAWACPYNSSWSSKWNQWKSRSQNLGIWNSSSEPMAPWDYRQQTQR